MRLPNANYLTRPKMATEAIIVGGGIAGAATGLALAQSGVSTTIYEQANAIEEFGAGLQLTPNATRILSSLGVLDQIRCVATEPRAVRVIRGSDDGILLRMPLQDAEKRWGAPYLTIHRADLLKALIDAANANVDLKIEYGARLAEFSSTPSRVKIVLKSEKIPREDEADILIGADGLRSRVRDIIRPTLQDEPTFTRRVAFRAAVDSSDADQRLREPEVYLRLGRKAHLVHYPLRGGATLNLVAVIELDWRGTDDYHPWDGAADRQALERAFAKWSRSTRDLIAAVPTWRAWPLYCRPSIGAFTFGRVALVGDAAHAMEPFLAQGAAQAIEDAGAFKSALSRRRDLPSALAAYSEGRVARATRIQREASRQGQIYHLKGLPAFARDTAMRALGAERLRASYDWLYGA